MLQPKLNLRVSQRQVLTPGLVQMVSVLALNKLELKDMINTEMVENPVLEELEESAASIEELSGREAERERSAEEVAASNERTEKKDPFDEIDFGSYFQDYLDPGFRTGSSFEEIERPAFDNFLSQPSTLTDHLEWQLGSMSLSAEVRLAADLVVGNLNEDGYLTATDEELADAFLESRPSRAVPIPFERGMKTRHGGETLHLGVDTGLSLAAGGAAANSAEAAPVSERATAMATVLEGREIVNHLDPLGVGARDLRECLLIQIAAHRREAEMVVKRAQAQTIRLLDEAGDDLADEPVAGGLQDEDMPVGSGVGLGSRWRSVYQWHGARCG